MPDLPGHQNAEQTFRQPRNEWSDRPELGLEFQMQIGELCPVGERCGVDDAVVPGPTSPWVIAPEPADSSDCSDPCCLFFNGAEVAPGSPRRGTVRTFTFRRNSNGSAFALVASTRGRWAAASRIHVAAASPNRA
jgi:hypothetical protein